MLAVSMLGVLVGICSFTEENWLRHSAESGWEIFEDNFPDQIALRMNGIGSIRRKNVWDAIARR